MSKNNLPRKPVRFVPQNEELLKAQEGIAGQRTPEGTDYTNEEDVVRFTRIDATYRTPHDRMCGNPFFRRHVGGGLDYEYVKHKVIDAIHRAKDSGGVAGQLNNEEKTALCVLFPGQFAYLDDGMVATVAAVQCKLTPFEIEEVRRRVAAHLAEELNWNAGLGGGSVPGRHQTRSGD